MRIILSVLFLVGFASCAHAKEYSDDEIVNAIYKTEGGKHAVYPYGIRSVKCNSTSSCRAACLTTVKRNRIRFAKYGRRNFSTYIEFLASRYCPTSGNLSSSEKRLNGNWLKNMLAILNRREVRRG